MMKKAEALRLRHQVQTLAQQGMKKTAIANRLGMSRKFVHRWVNAGSVEDQRGWQLGRKRSYTNKDTDLVIQARKELKGSFFSAP